MAARELWFGWLGRLSNLLNTAADLTSDSVSGRCSLYTEVYRWWVSKGSHEHHITFIEIEGVGEGGEPFLHNQRSVAPILYLQRCFSVCVVFHSFFRNCLQEWSVYMCQILYLIAEACLATDHMLLEINTHDIYSPADTNYKTTGGCRHIFYKSLRDFIISNDVKKI